MKAPDIPAGEKERLEELRAFDILDTGAEASFDALVRLASHIAGTPIALVSLIDEDRQWFKARVGLAAQQTGRDISFCGHAVAEGEMLVVPDAYEDTRFHDNPLVVGEPNIRFYAGVPLQTQAGHILGTLCVIDREPSSLSDEQVELLGLLADQVVRLIEIRRTVEEWRRVRDESRAFFETSLDLQCVATFDGYFGSLNPAWTKLLGYSREQLRSKPFVSFIHPEDVDAVVSALSKLQSGGSEIRDFQVRFLTVDGESRTLQFNATVDREARTYIASARDVTASEAHRIELEEARVAAEQASQAKSTFLANMSHELRTPLNSVIGFSNILLKNKEDRLTSKELDYLGRIRKNGKHLLSLLNDILDLSKIEVGQLEFRQQPVDLVAVVADVHQTLAPESDRLHLEAEPGLHPILADELRVRQVVTNLVGNALKFTPQGDVFTRVVSEDGRPVRLEVIDEGIGISPQNLERIFEPFEQESTGTEREFGGTGLGLAISKSLVESMGFSIGVTSEVGRGTTFFVHFDEVKTQPAELVATPEVVERDRRPKPRRDGPVLVVDDEPESRLLLESAVAELGIPVVAVDSPDLAIPLAEAVYPRAVLLDLMMPVLDGFDVLAAFEAHDSLSDVPVVVVSIVGTENRDRLPHAMEVVDKPIKATELARILGGGRSDAPVLIVDDDPEARTLVAEVLDSLGYQSVEATNGAEALDELQDGEFAAIVLDLSMPVMDGVEFLKRLRADDRFRRLPVVVFSAVADSNPLGIEDSVIAVLRKNGDLDALHQLLRRVLRLT